MNPNSNQPMPAPGLQSALSACQASLPAAQNLTPEFFASLSKLGLTVVIVMFQNIKAGHPVFDHEHVAETLGRDLEQAGIGSYDSTGWLTTQHWHFYHCRDLSRAIAALKTRLESLRLLDCATILVADSPNEVTTWWPATGETTRHVQ